MANLSPSITELAAEVSKNTTLISDYLKANNLPAPSFAADGPATFPIPQNDAAIQGARLALIEASKTLYDLAVGPRHTMTYLPLVVSLPSWSRGGQILTAVQEKHNAGALRVIRRFDIAKHVPPSGSISFANLSAATKLDVHRLHRV